MLPPNLTTKEVLDFQKKVREDPVWFREQKLGTPLWDKEKEIMLALRDNSEVAVKSCNAAGKSFTAAGIVHWWLIGHTNSIVITTAPTFRQVKEILWREIRGAVAGKPFYPDNAVLDTQINLDTNWFALGLSTDRPDQFQGFHSPKLLAVVDEASGVPDQIFEAIDGLKPTKTLLIGNPLRNMGRFAKAFKEPNVIKISISAFDTPNVKQGKVVIPGLITLEDIEKFKQRYGEDSDIYRVRILGEFPKAESDVFISVDEVYRAINREALLTDIWEKKMGVDVARYGCFDKETEILTNEGWKLFEQLSGKENVLTLDKNHYAKWQRISQLHKYQYNGLLNLYDGNKVNFCITDNHKLLVKGNKKLKEFKLKRYDELPNYFILKRTNNWRGKNPKEIKFKAKIEMPHGGIRIKEWKFNFGDWAEFLGWFVSEGNVYQEKRKNGRYRIMIAQYGKKMNLIKILLDRMGIKYQHKNNQIEFSNNEIGRYLRENCGVGAENKKIPHCVKEAKREIIDIFLKTFGLGDGTKSNTGGWSYFTSSIKLRDELQEILVKIGRAGKWSLKERKGSKFLINGREVIRKNDVYVVYSKQKGVDSDIEKQKVKKIFYNDFVYCVSVPNKIIMVRRRGCSMWSGNSDRTVIIIRHDKKIIRKEVFNKKETMEIAGEVLRIAKEERVLPYNIFIDVIGVGAGVVDRLREQGWGVQGINVALPAEDQERYFNLRAELFGKGKDWLKDGQLPNDDDYYELANIRYKFSSHRGQLQLESKEDMKKRGLDSPDVADAWALTFCSSSEKATSMWTIEQQIPETPIKFFPALGI